MKPSDFAARRKSQIETALAKMKPEDRGRFETLKIASDKTRDTAHWMLDEQLDHIMPELLTHIDGGGSFGVFVVDPEQMPIMPQQGPKLVGSNGKPL
jgi:hypothetical protein